MKNLILLFSLVFLFACQKKEKNFPNDLVELKVLEDAKLAKKVLDCELEIIKKLCLKPWFFDTIGIENQVVFIHEQKKSNIDHVHFYCNKTYFQTKKSFLPELTWMVKNDTLSAGCFYSENCSYEHDYIFKIKRGKLILDLICQDKSNYWNCHNFVTVQCIEYGEQIPTPSLIPYIDSINSLK